MKCSICGGNVKEVKKCGVVHMTCESCGAYGERKEPMMFVVYRVVAKGQDGNQGLDYERKKEFKTLDEADEYVKSRTDTNGWVSYTIVME